MSNNKADISFSSLASTAVRSSLGKRVFKSNLQSKSQGENNVISWIWNGVKQLAGFLISGAIKLLQLSFTALWGIIVNTLQFIYNFNWNATDEQLNKQIQAKWESVLTRLGGTLGKSVGYLACGVLPATVVMAFNEPLGAYLMKEVTTELAEELLQDLADLSLLTLRSTLETSLIWLYQQTRRFIKWGVQQLGNKVPPSVQKMIKAWGSKGSEPWSFAIATENAVESIPNAGVRGFVEEFLEEAWEGCVEAGYVIAGGVDSYIASQKLANKVAPAVGDMKYVEVTPDRKNPDEKLILAGGEQLVKNQVAQTMVTYNLLRERNVGLVYAVDPSSPDQNRRFKPHVVLYFKENIGKKTTTDENGKTKVSYKKLTGEISFRLMNITEETITEEYVKRLAGKVKAAFGTPIFKWNKANNRYSYTDWDKGYQFSLLVTSEREARRITEQVLDIQSHKPNWDYLAKASTPVKPKSTTKAEKKRILGQVEEQPIRGRSGTVDFVEAVLFLYGRNNKPVYLYHVGGKRKTAVVR